MPRPASTCLEIQKKQRAAIRSCVCSRARVFVCFFFLLVLFWCSWFGFYGVGGVGRGVEPAGTIEIQKTRGPTRSRSAVGQYTNRSPQHFRSRWHGMQRPGGSKDPCARAPFGLSKAAAAIDIGRGHTDTARVARAWDGGPSPARASATHSAAPILLGFTGACPSRRNPSPKSIDRWTATYIHAYIHTHTPTRA
jgi:hypothetical protein